MSLPITTMDLDATVVSVRGTKGEDGKSTINDVYYIGRGMYLGGWKLKKSIFMNPYSLKTHSLSESIRLYIDHLYSSGIVYQVSHLNGRVLGCWCKPQYCHGDVLKTILMMTVVKQYSDKLLYIVPDKDKLLARIIDELTAGIFR